MTRFSSALFATLLSWLALVLLNKRAARPDAKLLRWPAYPLTDPLAARQRPQQGYSWDARDWLDAPFRRS